MSAVLYRLDARMRYAAVVELMNYAVPEVAPSVGGHLQALAGGTAVFMRRTSVHGTMRR